ncbi:MAG: hypothetical protein KF778_14620 [Rhodocyclaceae bacterium]|nr:hypothetical protein [Rhodocyclaceae bacterium]
MSIAASVKPGIGQTPATGSEGRIGLYNYLAVLTQLALVLLVLRQFQIESAAFLRLAMLACVGFAIHALLPLRMRLPFFVVLSMAGIGVVMGPANGVWMLLIGSLLIAVCHLPLSFAWRGSILLVLGGVLALQRAKLMPFPWSEAIWPILGAMFMFRLIAYFYDLRHDKTAATPVQTLAYFFMLPNACFPLFPVIDYKTFRRNYYDDDAYRIYQVGIDWMVRGVIHLLLYRYVYYYLTLAPHEVTGPTELLRYLVANFLLYLRVSGLFHLIIGLLYLFGFRLPETHNRYLLASSFTDFWRRINIYWKEFMQKVFYYPAVFKLKKLGTTKALVLATLYVFAMTWFLHAYQWFWLRGTLLLVPQDILFWTILGLLVVANSLWEIHRGRARSLGAQERNWRSVCVTIAKTYATFWFICVLWSFWTAESLQDWFGLWAALAGPYKLETLLFPALALVVIGLGSIPTQTVRNVRASAQDDKSWMRSRAATLVALVLLIGVSREEVSTQLGSEVATVVHSLRSGRLSRLDVAKLERGYYENLLSVDRFNSQLWEVYTKKPANWLDVENAGLKRFAGGFAQVDLIPAFVSETRYGQLSINRFGMRDQNYSETPAAGTWRAALLGSSSLMGWGVGDGETFEALIESRLNAERAGGEIAHHELLNMGVPGYKPPQQLVSMERALRFTPQAVIYVATGREPSQAVSYLAEVMHKGIAIPYAPLRDIVDRAGVHAGMDEAMALKLLMPYRREVLRYVYGHIADQARAAGSVPVWVFLPQVRAGNWVEETPEALETARAAGYVVIDLSRVYEATDIQDIRLAEWDDHPNARGHQLVARRLYEALIDHAAQVFPHRAQSAVPGSQVAQAGMAVPNDPRPSRGMDK